MEPKYSVSTSKFTKSGIDIYFAQPVAPETAKKIRDLQNYSGIIVHNQPRGNEFYIITTPVWEIETVVQEVVSILESEGFDRDSILIK